MSQSQLAELVGRSTSTIRSWERDKSKPNDPQVLATLAAILGVDERQLFEKAEAERPDNVEPHATVQQALATLSVDETASSDGVSSDDVAGVHSAPVERDRLDLVGALSGNSSREAESVRRGAVVVDAPAFVAPPDPYVQTPLTPTVGDLSYVEDNSQRQLYRVRNLATMVAVVALIVMFIWAIGEGLGALGEWWDDFFGNLRL